MKKITILCKADGTVEITSKGWRGQSCRQATAFLEDGAERVSEKLTPEFYQQEGEREKVSR